jgi:hypothetical protein
MGHGQLRLEEDERRAGVQFARQGRHKPIVSRPGICGVHRIRKVDRPELRRDRLFDRLLELSSGWVSKGGID